MKNSLVIQTLKKISLSFLLLNLTACNFLGDHSKAPEPMEETSKEQATQKEDAEAYVVQPNYDHPKFKELDAAFKKQKHRFEIDRCEFKYNDQSFFIGNSYDKIIEILGKPDKEPVLTLDKLYSSIRYNDLGITIWFSEPKKKVYEINFTFSDLMDGILVKYNIVKFRKTPYILETDLNQFIELCDLSHEGNLSHDKSSFYIENEKKCEDQAETFIGSRPHFENIGGGHMTITGSFDSKTTGPIRYISIEKQKD
ncbi:hypothetical protein [uncultured Nonlabens sp.]|uniref:DUF7738 domain-containing protein n=1 Tax=uncultured Nonlabens sp. TaxID=859306 RepID=UPI0026318C84|nr:hypothetical protein [uncultured Nonlabens sp.]